jgi:hypothetical protein
MYVQIFFVASVTCLILDITKEVLSSLLVHVEVELQRLVDVDSGRVLCHDLDVSGEVVRLHDQQENRQTYPSGLRLNLLNFLD